MNTPGVVPPPTRRIAFSTSEPRLEEPRTRAAQLAALLRAAAARGIRRFELSQLPLTEEGWSLAATAVGSGWAESTVFVSESAGPAPPAVRPGEVVRLYERPARTDPDRAVGETVGVRFPDLGAAEAGVEGGIDREARWVSLPGSLLEAGRVRRLIERNRSEGRETLMTDPHAGGRLDGGLLSSGVLDHPGAPRPLDLAELQRQYAPVLPLGFLTAGRRRTLGQAAVAFVLTLGAVPAIRFRDARQLAELTDPPATEPLSDAELSRLERIAEIPPGAGAPRATPEFK